METVTTERLLLRPWRMEDAQDLYAYARDPEVGPHAGWRPHADVEESKKILAMFQEKGEVWAIEERSSGRVIGSLGLEEDAKRSNPAARSMGYVLARPWWGQGLMTEAAGAALAYGFERMGLEVVSICHFDFNARSKRVIEKLGFVYEGTLRRAHVRVLSGKVCDELCYSLTREEYAARRTAQVQA